jgi:CheY-like chemotaxis protein
MREIIDIIPHARLVTALTGANGVELAEKHRPDLILLDIRLPDISGYEVLKLLQGTSATAGIPVIALTGEAMPREIQRGQAAGFRRYITKPFSVKEMVRVIGATAAESVN